MLVDQGANPAAVRHLFRNLHNAPALRSNPIVGHFFAQARGEGMSLADAAVLARIREAVEGIARSLASPDFHAPPDRAQRLRELAIRCVLHREPHKKVASDLGVSERTLFRDLDEVKELIAGAMPSALSLGAPAVRGTDPLSLPLRHADLLRGIGRFEDALARLDDIAREVKDPVARVIVWNESAKTLTDCGALDIADHTLERSRTALDSMEKISARTVALGAELDLTASILLTTQGRLRDAVHAAERAAATVAGLETKHHTEGQAALSVRVLSHLCHLYRDTGDLARGEECIARARSALEALPNPPYSAQFSFLVAAASTRLYALGDLNRVLAEVTSAVALAQRHGMLRDAVNVLGFEALLNIMLGRPKAAREISRRALITARSVSGPTEFRFLCSTAASAETAAGSPAVALAIIAEARSRTSREGYTRLPLQAAEVEALVATGHYDSAIEAADNAIAEKAAGADIKLYLGRIYLGKMEALAKKGDAAAAGEALENAIPLLESAGKPHALARAYAYSARLTGNRAHGKAAQDLLAVFRPTEHAPVTLN